MTLQLSDNFAAAAEELRLARYENDVQHRRVWRIPPKPHHFAAFAASSSVTGLISSIVYSDPGYLQWGAAGVVATFAGLLGKELIYQVCDRRYRQSNIKLIRANRIHQQNLERLNA